MFLEALKAGACKPLQRELPCEPLAVVNDPSNAGALSKYYSMIVWVFFILLAFFFFSSPSTAGRRLMT